MIRIEISGKTAAEVAAKVADLAQQLKTATPAPKVLEVAATEDGIQLRSPDRDDGAVRALIDALKMDLALLSATDVSPGSLVAFVETCAGTIRAAGFTAVDVETQAADGSAFGTRIDLAK